MLLKAYMLFICVLRLCVLCIHKAKSYEYRKTSFVEVLYCMDITCNIIEQLKSIRILFRKYYFSTDEWLQIISIQTILKSE